MNYKKKLLLLLIIISIVTCKKKAKEEEKKEEIPPVEQSVKFTPEEIEKAKVKVEPISKTNFSETISLVGEVTANPDKITKITARVSGRVRSVHFVEGHIVQKNSLLAIIDSPDVARLRSKYFSTHSRYKAAQNNSNRLKELGKLRLAGEQEIINAESEVKSLHSELKAEKENLTIIGASVPSENNIDASSKGFLEVKSLIGGLVITRDVIQGSQVEPSTVIATIGDISEVWFMIKIFEKDLSKVSEGTIVNVILNSYPDVKYEGKVDYIGIQIDPGSRTVTGRVVLNNPDKKAKIGLFGRAEIAASSAEAFSVPKQSITMVNGEQYIIIEIAPNEFKFRKVEIGKNSKDRVEIKTGVVEGEKVVVSGIYEIKARILKPTFGEGE